MELFQFTKTLLLNVGRQLVLETLYALTSNTKLVKEAMAKGLCNSADCFLLNGSLFFRILNIWMSLFVSQVH